MKKPFLYITSALLFFGGLTGFSAWGQTIALISPNTDGLSWSRVENIEWTTSTTGWAPGDTIVLELSSDGGIAYPTTIARNLPYDLETFRFHTSTLANGNSYRVRISKTGDPGVSDESGYNFTINNPITGTAYYVNDAVTANDVYCTAAGNDANDGRSPATPRLTLQTIINDYILGPGDVVHIDTGAWIRVGTEAALTAADKGSALSPLYFAGSPNGTIFSGNYMPESTWRIYINGSSYLTFSGLTLESTLAEGIYLNAANFITIASSTIRGTARGIRGNQSNNISVLNNLLDNNNQGALSISSGSNHLISGNTASNNTIGGSYTIYVDRTTATRIRDNSVRNNFGTGIVVAYGNNNSVINNQVRDNSGDNIYIVSSVDARVIRNILLSPGGYNLNADRNSQLSVLNNFLYGKGISIGRYEKNIGIFNNIIWAYQANTYCLYSSGSAPEEQGILSDFNLIFPTGGARAGYWKNIQPDLRSWVLASGQDGRSRSENPLLVNFAGENYHLQSTEGSYHNGAWLNDPSDSPGLNAGRVADTATQLAAPLTSGADTVQMVSATGFLPGPGRVQVNDDIISYSGITANTLTGCAGVIEPHPAGTGVFQPVGSAYNRESAPTGDRVNIGRYGNTTEASRSSRKSLLVTSPRGGPEGTEKWAGKKDLDWRTIGTGWGPGDTLAVAYSGDSISWTTLSGVVAYDAQPYPSWNTLSVADSPTGRIRLTPSTGEPAEFSGAFIVDNTPPIVGLTSPLNGAAGQSRNTALISEAAFDSIAGLHSDTPYYFRIDTAETFDTPNLNTSGWLAGRVWYVGLQEGTDYYWQVRARDDADPANVSDFFAETATPGSWWKFRTAQVLHAEDIESETTGLRWMLDNYDLEPGDTIYVAPGTYAISAPLELTAGDQGDEATGVRIEGFNGEVILDGAGVAANCLQVTGDYFEIENFSTTNAVSSGVLITGNHNTLRGGQSFLNGGDGVEIRGDYNTVANTLARGNLRAGFRLTTAYRNRLLNNTAAGNGTREIFLEDSPPNGSIETVLRNNILSAAGAGRTAIYVESASRTGIDSDYNNLYAGGGADLGHWGGEDIATFSQWTEISLQDKNSLSANPLFVGGANYRLQSTAGSYKPGIGWTTDGNSSPGLDRGDPLSVSYLETAPNGGRINLGAYGNTLYASRSPAAGGRNFYVNDGETEYDYFCSTAGLPWPLHNGASPASPLDSIAAVFNHHTLQAGDTIYVDTGRYDLAGPVVPPLSGNATGRLAFAGSPRGAILDAQGVSPYCFQLTGRHYISIGGFILANPTENSLYALNSNYLRFSRNRVVGTVLDGLYLYQAYGAALSENRVENNLGNGLWAYRAYQGLTARGNTFSNNFGHGIQVTQGDNLEISGNRVLASGGSGIRLSNISGAQITDNTLTENGPFDSGTEAGISLGLVTAGSVAGNTISGSRYGIDNRSVGTTLAGNRLFANYYGLYLYSGTNCQVENNLIHNNQEWGLYVYAGGDTTLANNIFFDNGLYEIFLRRESSQTNISNNIISPQGIGNYGIYAEFGNYDPVGRGHRFDYNIFFPGGGSTLGYWEAARNNLRSWQTAGRQDGHSLVGDPLFVNPAGGDFHLRSTGGRFDGGRWFFDGVDSPGLNRGDPEAGFSRELPPAGGRLNIGAYGNTAEASRSAIKSLALTSPVGTARGMEKWSQTHNLSWRAIGESWALGDLFALEYSTDGSTFTLFTSGIPWPTENFLDWDTAVLPDGETYQVRLRQTAGGTATTSSGLFIIDNSPPVNVGCLLPPEEVSREPLSTVLVARETEDSPAGLAEAAYYFQLDTTAAFDSPGLQTSDWREYRTWTPDLLPNTWYYWRVRARDAADPANESAFFGETDTPGGWRTFKTIGVYHALDIESPTDGLRWILDNVELTPGDIVYVESGAYPLSAPLEFSPADGGDEDDPVRVIGVGGEVLLDGTGRDNCLVISGDYIQVENFSFSNAGQSGVLITGDHNTVQGGRSFNNGRDGIEVTGDWTTIRNMLTSGNGEAGIRLFTAHHCTLENNTSSGNGTFEVRLEDEPPNPLHPERPVGSTHASLRNSILDAGGPGRFAVALDQISQTGFVADYNLLYAGGGAEVGYWNSATQGSFSDWTGASGQDRNSLSAAPLFVGAGDYHLQSTRGSYHGGVWLADPGNSPGLDRGDPAAPLFYESAPNGGRINLGRYGNTLEASWAIGTGLGRIYYVNDSSTSWDYYCTTGGLPWPEHNGLSPEQPLDSIQGIIDRYSLTPGDTVYVDTGSYYLEAPLQFPASGSAESPITIAGSPRGTVIDAQVTAASCLELTNRTHISLANLALLNPRGYGLYANQAHFLRLAGITTQGASQDGVFVYLTNRVRLSGCLSSDHGRHGFYFTSQASNQGIDLRDCVAERNTGSGLYLSAGTGNSIASSAFRYNGVHGLFIATAYGITTVEGNTATGNRERGYSLSGHNTSTGFLVADNQARSNHTQGFYIVAPNASRITGNRAAENLGEGFSFFGSNNSEILNNLSCRNVGSGFKIDRSPGAFLLNNVGYRNAGEANIVYSTTNTNLTLRNNIFWATGAGNHCIRMSISDPATLGWRSNYNCLLADEGAFIGFLSSPARNFSTLFDWQVAGGLDGASINFDPVFVDPAGEDFHIQSPLGSYHNGYWNPDLNASPGLNQGQVYLAVSTLVNDIFPASPFIDLDDATDFTAGTDRIEINGNIIYYTGKTTNRLTGVTGISTTHRAGSGVFQPVGSDYTREPEPHGERIDIGAYGGTKEASLSLRKTLPILQPLGGEKWSGSHNLRWLAIPADEWSPGEPIAISYSTDGFDSAFSVDTAYYPTQNYNWDTLLAGGDAPSYQVRITGGGLATTSGVFTIDNTPPYNIACLFPEDLDVGLPTYIPIRGQEPADTLVGLHNQPYYFQLDTSPAFSGPGLQSSGWLSRNAWRPVLNPGTTYYWRVRARDGADLPNVSGFCGFTADTDGYGTFSTAHIYRATDIESATTGLRWILDNYNLNPGDTIIVEAGTHPVTSPLVISEGGSRYFPLRITGSGLGPLLDGGSGIENCLVLEADYVILDNISFTAGTGAGLLITGAHNIIREGSAYLHGGSGVEIAGPANQILNFLAYGNSGPGFLVRGAESNRLASITSHDNQAGEVVFATAPYSSLSESILWATAAGFHAVAVDADSENGFVSDYNNLFQTGSALVGYWSGDRADLGAWRGASLQDLNSISLDPLFFDSAGGDYHLKSRGGRWAGWLSWVTTDAEDSPSIDAGNPATPYFRESSPKGGRLNQGAYGNTIQASRSYNQPGTNYYLNDLSLLDNVFTTAAGSDSNNGRSPGAPKRTLVGQGGILSIDLEPGDSVFLDTGEYPLSGPALIYGIHSGTAGNPVSFIGSPNVSLVDGNFIPRAGIVIEAAEHIVLDRLYSAGTLGDPDAAGTGYGVRGALARSITLRESDISWHGQARGEGGGGVRFTNSTDISLEGNRVGFTTGAGFSFDRGGSHTLTDNLLFTNTGSGISSDRAIGLSFTGNIIYNNRGAGIYLIRAATGEVNENTAYSNRGAGISVTGDQMEIRGNLVYGNNIGAAIGLSNSGILASGTEVVVANNTLYRNRGNEFQAASPGISFRNNIAWANGVGGHAVWYNSILNQSSDFNLLAAGGGAAIGHWTTETAYTLDQWQLLSSLDSHSLGSDPLFVEPAGTDGMMGGAGGEDDDFHLQSTEGSYRFGSWTADLFDSPGLNTGNPGDPYDRETAPAGGRVNLGAYGNTPEASRSSLDTLFLNSPLGGAAGAEKWSGIHDLSWEAFGPGWGPGRMVNLDYSPDGSSFFSIITGAAWNLQTYPSWDTTALTDGKFYQVRVSDSFDPAISSISGRFIVDNTAPTNVGAVAPVNNQIGIDPVNASFRARTATDPLSGRHELPYYFRVDTVNTFDSSNLIVSDWIAEPDWNTQSLLPDTWYYWQVRARDAADLPNVSPFCADLNAAGTAWVFKTARVYYVTAVEGPNQLRDILSSQPVEQGDIIRLRSSGDFPVSGTGVIVPAALSGTAELPIRIEGYNGIPLLYGDGSVNFLLDVQSYYTRVQGIDFTGSGDAGVLLSGDHNTVNRCRSFEQGGAGVAVTGSHNLVQNTISYLNSGAGISLDGGAANRVYNNSLYGNETAGLKLANAPQSNLRNNISWAVGAGAFAIAVDFVSQTELISDYNDLYASGSGLIGIWDNQTQVSFNNWRTVSGLDANSISADPKFYKIAYWGNREYIYDLHLRSAILDGPSPCLNRGIGGAGLPTDDYDGEVRPFGVVFDIGADEWVNTNPANNLPDYWELKYFGDLDPDRRDSDDFDFDSLNNINEYRYYTDPTDPDTDNDGLLDGLEVYVYSTNPLDPDSDWDGLLDGAEIGLGTDPAHPDSDRDGLLDGASLHAVGMSLERIAYLESYQIVRVGDWFMGETSVGTNPLNPDTDGDDCPDGWEVFYGLDPLDDGRLVLNNGGIGDPDGDRLNNYEEYRFGTSPIDPADPTTRYVDGSRPGGGNGLSWATAWNTIRTGLDWKAQTAVPAIVQVSSGVYYESGLDLDGDHSGLALLGAHPYQRPVINGGGAGRIFTAFNLQTAKLDSLEIRSGLYNGPGSGIYLFDSSPTLSNLIIHNNISTGVGRGGAIFVTGSASRPLIINNTISKNRGYSNYGGIYVASGTPAFADNILWGNGIDLYRFGLTTEMVSYCNIGSVEGGFNIIGFAGNISAEPRFQHYGDNRFHLATFFGANNPNINTGTSRRAMLKDFEGEARWNYLSQAAAGGGIPGLNYFDIGADEYFDSDYNTLPDWWEMKYFAAIGQNPGVDPDGDTLSHYQEYYYLTDPLKFDTAVSGISDGAEVTYWNTTHQIEWPLSPAGPQRWDSDADGDGIINILDADSDTDRLIDGYNLDRALMTPADDAFLAGLNIVDVGGWFMGERTIGTDPAAFDTDGDGLGDGDEVYYWVYTHNGLFPSSAHSSWDTDWDGDGIPNILDRDSDGDLLPDGWEAQYGLDPNDDGYYFLEQGAGGDPDGNRINNYLEYLFGTNPLNPADPRTVVVDINGTIGVNCDYNSIKDAIAGETGPVRILVRRGVYFENEITPKNRMALLGEYAANTIIDASGGRGVIFSSIDAGLLDGFTIRNAAVNGPGAAILSYASSPFISNSIVSFNSATGVSGHGAALYAMESSFPIVVNCTIASNRGADGRGGVTLDSPADDIFLINNIFWDNETDLFGTQTDMVHYCNLQSGLYAGVNSNVSEDPQFTNAPTGNFRIHWTSPMICAGGYPLAGGFDMDGVSRPQINCLGPVIPGPPVFKPEQESFNIGAHEAKAVPSPTPSATPSPSPSTTPAPSATPSSTPTPPPPFPPTPVITPPIHPTRTPTPVPTATPVPPFPPTPPTTPHFPTRTPTPIPTATPEFTPTLTPPGHKTPTPTPTPINFYYRDPVRNSYLYLFIDNYDTYYAIAWSGDDWRDIHGLPQRRWYAPLWTVGTTPGDSQWSEWTYHETETQYLEPSWPTPSPTPYGMKTPTPIPDFYYRDPIHQSFLHLWISNFPDPNTYYSIGWSGNDWQEIYDLPDYRWYAAQWTYGEGSGQTWWSEWTYHRTEPQYLQALWITPTPSPTPVQTRTPTPPPTVVPTASMAPTPLFSPTPSVTATPTSTPTPSYAYWYSAAGATEIDGMEMHTFFAVNNPTDSDAYVEITALDKDGVIIRKNDIVSPESRYSIYLNDLVRGTRGEKNPSVSVLIYDLTDRIILVDRSMYWNAGGIHWGGGHNSVVSYDAAVRWALPEGATHNKFNEYIHIVNPDENRWANVRTTFMNEKAEHWVVEKSLRPESNWTIHVNDVVGKQPHISTLVESLNNVPVAADRTMYWDGTGYGGADVKWVGGHSSRGTTERSTRWYISEGATHMFDHWILVTNPDREQEAVVRITLLDLEGELAVVNQTIPPLARYTCYVNRVVGWDKPHVSAIVESLPRTADGGGVLPATYIMCERATYWKPFINTSWGAGHATIGALYGAPVWYLPEGATIGFDEFILLANPDPVRTANARITFYFENEPPQYFSATIEPRSRQTVYVNRLLQSPAISARIEETTEPFEDKVPIIAERSMYWHSYTPWIPWVAGHGTIGIPVLIPGK